MRRLLTPLAVLFLVVVMAVAAPVASLMGAVSVNAGTKSDQDFTITHLPARYAEVGETLVKGETLPSIDSGTVVVWHANREQTVSDNYTYSEEGQYEWRFYADSTKKQLIASHTVWVTQPTYVITMPSVVPTVAPKDLTDGKLVLPLPDKLTADDKEIKLGDQYQLTVKATLGDRDLTATVGYENVTVDLGSDMDKRVGTLQVTYVLQDAVSGRPLVAKVLNDIEIKNVLKDKVTFSSNPSAPSVQSLSFGQEVTLTAPTANSAKYEDTTFNVEATTKIIGFKFVGSSTQPSNWDKIDTIKCESGVLTGNDRVAIDGLKVTTKKLGWYKFLFRTDTLFGNNSANDNETDGEYWSDAVHIKSDGRSPEFKFVAEYATTKVDGDSLNGVAFADLVDEYSDRYPLTTNSSEPAADEQKVLVGKTGLTLPAIFATDNFTPSTDLKMTITVAQIKDDNGVDVRGDNTQAVYYNQTLHPDAAYAPNKPLQVNFVNTEPAKPVDNYLQLKASAGLYLMTISIQDTAPKYDNNTDATSTVSGRTTQRYMYFKYKDSDLSEASNSPTIDQFQVSDVYLWEGKTFDFAVPTYSDTNTPTANLAMDYFLVNETSKQIFSLDNDDIVNGRMYVDLATLLDDENKWTEFSQNTSKVALYATARNFTYLQHEWNTIKQGNYVSVADLLQSLPESGKVENGITFLKVPFIMHAATTNTNGEVSVVIKDNQDKVDGNEFVAGKAVHIASAKVDWQETETDGRISVAVYQIKQDGSRVAVNVVDGNEKDANQNENVSTVAFRKTSYEIKDWYFTPRVGGKYQVVVTAKDNASSVLKGKVTTIVVDPDGGLVPSARSVTAQADAAPDDTLAVGTTGRVLVPNLRYEGSTKDEYLANNRKLYTYNEADQAYTTEAGYYTITVKGICDPECLTGERFVPSQAGTYTFTIDYFRQDNHRLSSVDYVVEVTNDGDTTTSAIKLDTAYGDLKFERTMADGTKETVPGISKEANAGTATSPKYAITLPQFMLSNLGGTTNFIVSHDMLRQNLEKIADATAGDTYQYLYPAIAIPMPNLISGGNLEDVEITVQKSGYTEKLVSSKVALANGKNSLIDMMDGYYVFRPEGKFKNNGADFLASGDSSVSAVYVITYKTKSTSLTFNVTIGDPVKGELTFDDGFLTYDNGKKSIERGTTPVIDKNSDGNRVVTINMKKVNYVGNNALMNAMAKGPNAGDNEPAGDDRSKEYMWQKASVSVTYEGVTLVSTGGWDGKKDEDAFTYQFNLSDSGTYTVNVNLFNPYVNQTVTQSFEFTIDINATNKNVNLSTVWGVILVVLSVGLLAGVIFYFVKTARETRFLDAPKAPKVKKEKPNKKLKDQKEDVK